MAVAMFCFVAGLIGAASGVPTSAAQADAPPASTSMRELYTFESVADSVGAFELVAPSTASIDSTQAHQGTRSLRLHRDPSSEDTYSAASKTLEVDFEGMSFTVSGWLRAEEVSDRAGLWVRIDDAGEIVGGGDMGERAIKGSCDWTHFELDVPTYGRTGTVTFGAYILGEGTLWLDDLELLVDGRPPSEAPTVERVPSPLETDREFAGGSQLEFTEVTREQTARLSLVGKLWGFLKYHHPRVTGGEYHWDFELFRLLHEVDKARDRPAFLEVLVDWVESLGVPESCDPCAPPAEDVHLDAPVDWIFDSAVLGERLSSLCSQIYANRSATDSQFYVRLNGRVGNPSFTNEDGYADLGHLDDGYRLLALYRVWNIIEYWFPYRDLIGEEWDGVLEEFVPRVLAAGDSDAYALEMMQLIARIHDTHANLWSSLDLRPPTGDHLLPFALRFLDGRAIVTGLRASEEDAYLLPPEIEIGDEIVSLDGRMVADMVDELAPYYAASNEAARLRDMARYLGRGEEGACLVGRARIPDGQDPDSSGPEAVDTVWVEVERLPVGRLDRGRRRAHTRPGPAVQTLSQDIAYVKLAGASAETPVTFQEQAMESPGLIIDARGYPSQFLVFSLGRYLVESRTQFVTFTVGDPSNPGAFAWRGDAAPLNPPEHTFAGNIVILVDEMTQSSAEYHAMAFRAAQDAIVIGSRTAGADGNVSRFPIPGGLSSMISGIGVFYPDKTPTQRVGIVPDVWVEPTVRGIREGRDEVLEAAVRHLLGDSVSEDEVRRIAND